MGPPLSRRPRALRIPACAKINLGLEVLDRRADGYHELRTIFQTIDLRDEVAIRAAGEIGVTCDDPRVPEGDGNLAYRAACELARFAGGGGGAAIHIAKRIPVAAGLGGGSSDAAAVLLGLDRLWDLGLGRAGLLPLARRLGADVAYFMFGGTALGLGRGDEVYPLERQERAVVLVVDPGLPVSTAAVFARVTASLTPKENGNNIFRFISGDAGGAGASRRPLVNDLEAAACEEVPELGRKLRAIRTALMREGARGASLSGSGSACYGLFTAAAPARRAQAAVEAMGCRAFRNRTLTTRQYRALLVRALGDPGPSRR